MMAPKSADDIDAGVDASTKMKAHLGPTVLVIDDDEVGRALLCEAVGKSNRQVLTLNSPIGATQVATREQVDVVVLDVEMPNLRGDALAKLFRSNPRISHVGLILVSGCSTEQLVALGQRCGADEVVSKRHVRDSLPLMVQSAWMMSRARSRQDESGARAASQASAERAAGMDVVSTSANARGLRPDGKK